MCQTRLMRNVLMVLVCAACFAQQQPGTPAPVKTEEEPIRVTTTVVVAPTTVLDKRGDYINGLQIQDFQLYDNNKLQTISADAQGEPLSLVVAVQKSSNLNEILPKIQHIGSLLSDLISGADGETAVIAFDHRVQVVQEFTHETEKISEAMRNLKPGSSQHAVNDAVIAAVRLLKNRKADRRRILLLIAEKRDKGSEIRTREVLMEAEFANVAIYSLDISSVIAAITGTPIPPPPPSIPTTAQHIPAGGALTPTTIEQNYYTGNYMPIFIDIFKAAKSIFVDDNLDIYTRFTGGKQYSFISERSLEKAVQGISQELHNQYLLSYSPNNQTEGGFHEIRVSVNRANLEVRTRPGYWIASKPE